jgi:uncharacterized protein (TIGR00369 family)
VSEAERGGEETPVIRPGEGYHGLLGLTAEPDPEHPGQEAVVLTIGPEHLRTLNILHGGVVLGLLDTTLGKAAGTTAPSGHYTVTAQLNVNFIRPAWEGETLRGTAEIDHAGRRTAVVRGELRTTKGDLVATATGTFMHLPRPATATGRIEREGEPGPGIG